jgi:hypothetical protein
MIYFYLKLRFVVALYGTLTFRNSQMFGLTYFIEPLSHVRDAHMYISQYFDQLLYTFASPKVREQKMDLRQRQGTLRKVCDVQANTGILYHLKKAPYNHTPLSSTSRDACSISGHPEPITAPQGQRPRARGWAGEAAACWR